VGTGHRALGPAFGGVGVPRETLAVLSDPKTVADLREVEETRAAGEVYSTEEVLAEIEARRSRPE